MTNRFVSSGGILISLSVFAVLTAVFALPFIMRTHAAGEVSQRTTSHEPGLENYDIRTDKTAIDVIMGFRTSLGRSASNIADARDAMVRGERALKERVPTLKVEYNTDIRIPEVIAPATGLGRSFLTQPSSVKRSDILKDFLTQNTELVGTSRHQIADLKVFADYTNPDGNLSFVELNQEINGIPVFRGEVKAGFTRSGEMIRVINNLAPALDYDSLSTDFGDPAEAVRKAASYINNDLARSAIVKNNETSSNQKAVFGTGDSATTAEKMYFPTEPGVAIPAWRVLIWQPVNAYYIIVDARSGTMLWRKNITEDQTQAATYSVYANPNAMINVADNPFPMTPGPIAPNGTQGTAIGRTSITRIGNEAPYTFNNNGWINDGGDRTDGNAVQAGLDRDGVDGVDANSEAVNATRNFAYSYNPLNPNNNTGDAPIAVPQTYPGSQFQQGTTTQLFYITNWYHDELYRVGFTEQARNFQGLNFGRGGVEGDRIRGEGQDSSGVNNANFSTPADGGRGRMQMYVWTGPNPDIDGNLDADVVIHEITHGTSNRLHGNGSGLSTNMSRGMGEGWGDFYGNCLLSEPSDPLNGIYTTGAYDTYLSGAGVNNYYYAIRRFPKAVMSFTGGPNNRPHNPMTFADIDTTKINLTDGAFAPRFTASAPDQVHAAGEVWGIALWEARARLITRLGWADGNRKILQYVTDGMKLAPLGPTFLQERDAIIASAQASSPPLQANADVVDLWAGFAIRGMGFSAAVTNPGSGGGSARVVEAFDPPNITQAPQFGVSDFLGDNDGAFEPGETLTLTIPLTNSTGSTANGVSLLVDGGQFTVDYGTILNGQTVSRVAGFFVPLNTPCGTVLTLTFNVTSSLSPVTFTRTILIGAPNITFSESFDGVTAPAIPAGWTVTSSYAPMTFVSTTTSPDTITNSLFAADLPDCINPGCPTTNGGATELTSPSIPVNAAAALVYFRHKYNTEPGFDGAVLEVSVAGGAFQDILTAGGAFISNGYNGSLGVSSPNPLGGRAAWTGDSGGYITTVARMPASANGQNVQLRWRMGTDSNTAPVGGGWNVDTITFAGTFSCAVTPVNGPRSRADFDGDSRTDLSVYRPSEGNWYLNRSTQGLFGIQFGIAEDIPTPGDFDNDRKADIAVWRPSTGTWYRINSFDGTLYTTNFGLPGDIPQAGDFDGDLKDDIAVFRPSNGTWYWQNSSNGQFAGIQFGQNGDLPVAGDYDGDGRDDVSVFRPSDANWYRLSSINGTFFQTNFGLNGDLPVPADYDGDNRDDIALFRPSDGNWYWQNSSNGLYAGVNWGQNGDIPVPGDYDGDGRDDQAVYRAGVWYLNRSTSGFTATNFGLAGDIPVPKKYIP